MSRPIDRGRAVGEYDGALREIIHALKYGRRRSLAAGLARLMRARGSDVLSQADLAVPVPLHRRREWERGFNQARELARHLGLPVMDCLKRRRDTQPQTTLPAGRRHANVREAFALKPGYRTTGPNPVAFGRFRAPRAMSRSTTKAAGAKLEGARVVLVDDVSTTGATLDACALVLKEAGAREVYAITAARVVSKLL